MVTCVVRRDDNAAFNRAVVINMAAFKENVSFRTGPYSKSILVIAGNVGDNTCLDWFDLVTAMFQVSCYFISQGVRRDAAFRDAVFSLFNFKHSMDSNQLRFGTFGVWYNGQVRYVNFGSVTTATGVNVRCGVNLLRPNFMEGLCRMASSLLYFTFTA